MSEFSIGSWESKCLDNFVHEEPLPHLLTNFSDNDIELYETCIWCYKQIYKRDDVYIDPFATAQNGQPLYNTSALYTRNHNDKSEFWRIYDKLSKRRPGFSLITKEVLILRPPKKFKID